MAGRLRGQGYLQEGAETGSRRAEGMLGNRPGRRLWIIAAARDAEDDGLMFYRLGRDCLLHRTRPLNPMLHTRYAATTPLASDSPSGTSTTPRTLTSPA